MRRAEFEDPRYQSDLGDAYLKGKYLPKDPALGVLWLQKAANQGYAPAASEIGERYRDGDGVAKDEAAGRDWLMKAARHGSGVAANTLGGMYAEGRGAPHDDVQAYMWYEISLDGIEGAWNHDSFIRDRDKVAARMTAAQITDAKARAEAWRAEAEPKTTMDGIEAYESGQLDEAVRIFTPLAEAGNRSAQYYLGGMYSVGDGVTQDWATSMDWYLKAANQGHAGAQCLLGMAYLGGRGAPQNSVAAATWLRKAADQGVASAELHLGMQYLKGNGAIQNTATAVGLLQKAADQGEPTAQFMIGHMYRGGQGVPADNVKAYEWLGLAVVYSDSPE
ncbi:MAG: sel1 repeat family protein, partial [Asticcacaulis sp.]|nr:sel1 repeat family protein [Asticcacaulis sp.]